MLKTDESILTWPARPLADKPSEEAVAVLERYGRAMRYAGERGEVQNDVTQAAQIAAESMLWGMEASISYLEGRLMIAGQRDREQAAEIARLKALLGMETAA